MGKSKQNNFIEFLSIESPSQFKGQSKIKKINVAKLRNDQSFSIHY